MANVKDVQTMARNYANVQKLIGAEKIVVPGKSTTPEQWSEIYDKLGRGKLEDYKVELGQEDAVNPDFVKDFLPKLHAAGVLPHQAQSIMKEIATTNKTYAEAQAAHFKGEAEKAMNDLKTEWGQAYQQNMDRARAFLREFAGEAEMKAFQALGLGQNPAFIKLASKAAGLLQEDKIKGQGGSGSGVMTPGDARAKIAEMQTNVKGAYFNPQDPGHYAAKAEMQRLYTLAYPTEQK